MPKDKGYGRGTKMPGMDSGMSGKGVMGHEKKPKYVDAYSAQKRDLGRMDWKPMGYRGTPDQAFDYKY